MECRVALRIVTVIENLPKSLQLHLHRNSSKADLQVTIWSCDLTFSVPHGWPDGWDGCSRLLVLVNDWHVIGSFEPFCSNDTKKFSSASILLGKILKYLNSKVSSLQPWPIIGVISEVFFYHFYDSTKKQLVIGNSSGIQDFIGGNKIGSIQGEHLVIINTTTKSIFLFHFFNVQAFEEVGQKTLIELS